MTPEQKLLAKFLGAAIALVVAFSLGWIERGVRADLATANGKLDTYIQFGRAIKQRDAKFTETQAKLTALEERYTKDADDALRTNSALRSDLAVAQRMRLKGAYCPARGSAAGAAPAGVDPAVPLGLSEETRLAVFDLRKSIVRDRNALAACQAELAIRTAVAPPSP